MHDKEVEDIHEFALDDVRVIQTCKWVSDRFSQTGIKGIPGRLVVNPYRSFWLMSIIRPSHEHPRLLRSSSLNRHAREHNKTIAVDTWRLDFLHSHFWAGDIILLAIIKAPTRAPSCSFSLTPWDKRCSRVESLKKMVWYELEWCPLYSWDRHVTVRTCFLRIMTPALPIYFIHPQNSPPRFIRLLQYGNINSTDCLREE